MKRLYCIILSISCVLTLAAQQPEIPMIERLYMGAPLEVCPMLTPQQRYEILENANVGKKDTIINFLEGQSWVDSIDLNNQHIVVHQTRQSTIEMLYRNERLLVIQTFYAPLPSSMVYIVDQLWSNRRDIPIEMPDCHDMPATFIRVTIQNDSLLLENHTLDQVHNIEETIYRDCPTTTSIPLPF